MIVVLSKTSQELIITSSQRNDFYEHSGILCLEYCKTIFNQYKIQSPQWPKFQATNDVIGLTPGRYSVFDSIHCLYFGIGQSDNKSIGHFTGCGQYLFFRSNNLFNDAYDELCTLFELVNDHQIHFRLRLNFLLGNLKMQSGEIEQTAIQIHTTVDGITEIYTNFILTI